jgi:hypothetical protein
VQAGRGGADFGACLHGFLLRFGTSFKVYTEGVAVGRGGIVQKVLACKLLPCTRHLAHIHSASATGLLRPSLATAVLKQYRFRHQIDSVLGAHDSGSWTGCSLFGLLDKRLIERSWHTARSSKPCMLSCCYRSRSPR